ncbi:VOC family protein [Larkinella soli]|uniref:VOC family protein n=1 Tax=Larkinella soli TaxID=1770527 RepID=UPI000FFBE8C0|nr:hypothetical protein [Larkinella soli]
MNIEEVHLLTNDLDQTEVFYSQILNFPVSGRSAFHRSFRVGPSTLTFCLTQECRPFYHFAFGVPASHLQDAYRWLAARTPLLPFSAAGWIADFDNWNAQAFYFHDPAGNILELIAHRDLPDSNRPFSPAAISEIREIGIPVDEVVTERERICREYGLSYFRKGPVLDAFTAVGDDRGLLILTKAGRGWLPTGRPAEKHPLTVRFSVGDETYLMKVGHENLVEPQFTTI